MPTQPCIGFPADTLGSDGDAAQDLKNRIIYFPKANGSWANAAAYAFQGQVGPSILTGSGAPANTLGSPGQGYADLSSSGFTYVKNSQNAWVQTGQIQGAQGIAGPSGQSVPALTSQSYSYGPFAANNAALTFSGGAKVIPAAGTTQPLQFIPTANTTFAGATLVLSSANNPSGVTFNFVDVTANTTRFSTTIGTAGTVVTPTANVALTAGNVHQWTVGGTGTGFVQATPNLLQPATVGISSTYGPLFAQNFTTAPTSATAFMVNTASSITLYMGIPKTAFLLSAQYVNATSSSATVGLYNQAGTLLYSQSVPANTITPALYGPFTVNQYILNAGFYTWRVTSSGTGYISVLPQLCL